MYILKNNAIVAFLLILVFFFPSTLSASSKTKPSSTPTEYEVKAAFIYNFTKFIEWPEDASGHSFRLFNICIIGENPFGKTIKAIEKQHSGGRGFKVTPLGRHNSNINYEGCHILFVSNSEKRVLPEILEVVKNLKILTVSDIRGFAETGGIIGFKKKGKKVGLAVNPEAAKKADIKISSKLLKLADIVRE